MQSLNFKRYSFWCDCMFADVMNKLYSNLYDDTRSCKLYDNGFSGFIYLYIYIVYITFGYVLNLAEAAFHQQSWVEYTAKCKTLTDYIIDLNFPFLKFEVSLGSTIFTCPRNLYLLIYMKMYF